MTTPKPPLGAHSPAKLWVSLPALKALMKGSSMPPNNAGNATDLMSLS